MTDPATEKSHLIIIWFFRVNSKLITVYIKDFILSLVQQSGPLMKTGADPCYRIAPDC